MIFQSLSVSRSGRASDSRPRMQFGGNWLNEMGFVNGSLIQALPVPGGVDFHLYDENIQSYSKLFNSTKEKGGTLNRAYVSGVRKCDGPVFVTTGKHILKGGLKVGDRLIAKCEPGLIRARKVSENVRLVRVARVRNTRTGGLLSYVWLWGDWLSDIGFTPDTLFTAASVSGLITFTAHDKAVVYGDVVKFARQNKMKLLKISAKDGSPLISFSGAFVARAGFDMGDMLAAEYEYGVIKLQKLDPAKFGF